MPKLIKLFLFFLLMAWMPVTQADTGVKSLPAIRSQAEFDTMARVTDTPYRLPHIMFLIDRSDGNKIYYINSKRYLLHSDFAHSAYLSLEHGQAFFADNYLKPNRRFLMGNVSYQTPIKRWTFEFWEGDQTSAEFIQTTADVLYRTFFAPVAYKPNSLQQEEVSASIPHLDRILPDAIVPPSTYQPLSKAQCIGHIHIIARTDTTTIIQPDDIVVLDEAPVFLPPVAGIVTTQPASPLSHIHLRARAVGIPDAYIANAQHLFQRYAGQLVTFETQSDQYLIGHPSAAQIVHYHQQQAQQHRQMTPRFDLSVKAIAGLKGQRASSVIAYGAKSANLGEMMHAGLAGAQVPDGFTLPFACYDQFIRENHLQAVIDTMLHDPEFVASPVVRQQRLSTLRDRIQQGTIDPDLATQIVQQAHAQFPNAGLFVRSSTNSEDLPNFNGAGLYTTVPNVRGDAQLLAAIKTVWASVWNSEAYEAREQAGIDHQKVFMAVLIQRGINADSAGVMITADPFDPQNKDAIYISATRGLGIKVVDGDKVPEQLIYHPETNAVRVLTRSAEDSLLTFDAKGGVREVAIAGPPAVLTNIAVHQLAQVAAQIHHLFSNKPQDIEWAIMNGKVYIVQARPYIQTP